MCEELYHIQNVLSIENSRKLENLRFYSIYT